MFNHALLKKLVFRVTFLAGAAVSYSAHAATIVEDVNIPTPQTALEVNYLGTAFPEFNLALGTLNSLTFDITGSYVTTYVSGAIGFIGNTSNVGGTFSLGTPNSSLTGSGGSFSNTSTDTADVSAFIGTGMAQIGDVVQVGGGSIDSVTVSADSTVTYNYTPAISATPLPAALPLFASGLGAMGLFGWSRRRKNTAALSAA